MKKPKPKPLTIRLVSTDQEQAIAIARLLQEQGQPVTARKVLERAGLTVIEQNYRKEGS